MKCFVRLCICMVILSFLSTQTTAAEDGEKCTLVENCTKRAENASKSCYDFMDLLDKKCGDGSSYCDKYKDDLIKSCTAGFCKKCLRTAETAYEDCVKFYHHSVPSEKDSNKCEDLKNNLSFKCPRICQGVKGLTKQDPGKSCIDILESSPNDAKSGLYWIRPDGDAAPTQSYCDMSFQGGGWTLASYGYVATTAYGAQDKRNKNIPNMNHPNGYTWHPNKRNNSQGVISLEHGAVNLARGAKYMIMAAGGNPVSGGINEYSYVYFIDISHNPYKITFANHNRYHGGVGTSTIPKMHVVEFTVKALKGEAGSEKRYALGESLGISWGDTYPTGYGFSPVNAQYGTWNKGPFFPSFHSGDRASSAPCKTPKAYAPDITRGCSTYVHHGWHSLHTIQKTGQTSIWFK